MDIEWSHWRSFLAVADTGSLSAAARLLGLTQPTVGRQIAALEAATGRRLFLRVTGGMLLDEAAAPLVAEARVMAMTAAALERMGRADDAGMRGAIRIAASHAVAAEILPV